MRRWGWLLIGTLFLVAAGCAHTRQIVLPPSPVLPAASIQLQVGKDSNGNTVVQLSAKHLALPSRLSPAASNYVVWVEPRGQSPERKGMLLPDSNLNAQLRFITPDPSFTLVITAEAGPNPGSPSDRVISRIEVTRPS